MENVAEALRMAAGMMIAILLIGLAVYLFNSMSGIEDSKRDQQMQAEATEFNKRFSAFDRSSLYGTDVISVIGLAISNNKIYNQEKYGNPLGNYDPDSRYSIDIEFQLTNDIEKKTSEYRYRMRDTNGDGILEEIPDPNPEDNPGVKNPKITGEYKVLTSNKATNGFYSLNFKNQTTSLYSEYGEYLNEIQKEENKDKDWESQILYNPSNNDKYTNYKRYYGIEKIATEGDNTVKTTTKRHGTLLIRTTNDTSGYSDFKSTIFQCTEVKYNDVGRIYYMKFVAKKYVNNTRR